MVNMSTTFYFSAPKLLGQVRERISVKHYSIRTETQYVNWIKHFILFHGKRYPSRDGGAEVEISFHGLQRVTACLPRRRTWRLQSSCF